MSEIPNTIEALKRRKSSRYEHKMRNDKRNEKIHPTENCRLDFYLFAHCEQK